jgi:hypothetical protein
MNDPFEVDLDFNPESTFDSRDCVNLIIDGPGDTTVRPCRPELLPFLMAEREKLARWQAENEKEKAKPDAQEKPDEKNGHP